MKTPGFFKILSLLSIFTLGIVTSAYAQDSGTLTLEGHTDAVTSVVFSPDGTVLASSSVDGTVRLWNPVTGDALFTLEGHTGAVNQVDFSPDGAILASAGEDGTIRLWDAATGQEIKVLEGHTDAVSSVSFNTEGTLASGSVDMTIRLWDVESGEVIRVIEGHEDAVNGVDFNPQDVAQLVSISADHTVRLWNVVTGEQVNQDDASKSNLYSVAFHPDGQHVAIGYTVRDTYGIYSAFGMIWDTGTRDRIRPGFPASAGSNNHVYVAWTPDGSVLYVSQQLIMSFIYTDGALAPDVIMGIGSEGDPYSIAFSPDGSMIARGSANGPVSVSPRST